VREEAQLALLRERLAQHVVSVTRIRDERVAAALRAVPRHLFLPRLPPESAYRDEAIVTKRDAGGQPISSSSQPAIMAIMLDQLALAPGLRVLEIGAGTGYNAALMQHIVGPSGTVVSVDIDAEVAAQAREHLASAGYQEVVVVAADGADGYPPGAPYDRVIATVGVADLSPSWLAQLQPEGRIVVPFDVRGTQLAAAFERTDPGRWTGDTGCWTSVSLMPCRFMRIRGPGAGPERTVVLRAGLSVTLPDGLTLADGTDADAGALAGFLAAPPAELATGVRAEPRRLAWGFGLWLAAGDPRSCNVAEERPPGGEFWLRHAPMPGPGQRLTAGILDSGGLALLTAARAPSPGAAVDRPGGPGGPGGPVVSGGSGQLLTLAVAGFGPHAADLAGALAAHVQAWDRAGQPEVDGLHIDAYPRPARAWAGPAHDGLLIERPRMSFVVYRA
jgi:protein-L-isoaspartate(D-aspartate) O-methyltransferase